MYINGRLLDTCSQNILDMYEWERIIKTIKPTKLIELGTGSGIMSMWLNQFVPVTSYDNYTAHYPNIVGDIFTKLQPDDLKGHIILFCDNGNKPLEFKTFVPHLDVGSIVAVHDWGTEFHEKDIDYSLVEKYHETVHTVWLKRI